MALAFPQQTPLETYLAKAASAYTELLTMARRWYSVEGEQSNGTNNHDENLPSDT